MIPKLLPISHWVKFGTIAKCATASPSFSNPSLNILRVVRKPENNISYIYLDHSRAGLLKCRVGLARTRKEEVREGIRHLGLISIIIIIFIIIIIIYGKNKWMNEWMNEWIGLYQYMGDSLCYFILSCQNAGSNFFS